jgi:xanthine dehydrogenase YagS FAD-binding subunit
VPWVLESPEALADATPLPGTAYKVEIAEALVRRALEKVA